MFFEKCEEKKALFKNTTVREEPGNLNNEYTCAMKKSLANLNPVEGYVATSKVKINLTFAWKEKRFFEYWSNPKQLDFLFGHMIYTLLSVLNINNQ